MCLKIIILDIFRFAKKTKPSNFSTHLSSYDYDSCSLGGFQIYSWRPYSLFWFHEQYRTRRDVFLLFSYCVRSDLQKKHLVEKTHNTVTAGTSFNLKMTLLFLYTYTVLVSDSICGNFYYIHAVDFLE